MNPSLFHVFLILFIITSGIASAIQDDVKDATGEMVVNNYPYHIGPVNASTGGRFKLAKTTNNKPICPFYVVQDPSLANLGDLFMFDMINKKRPFLLTSHKLGIDSGLFKGPCEKSTYWTIPNAEGKPHDNLVTTGGRFKDNISCFQVVKYPKPTNPKVPSYMIQHCPSLCGSGPQTCFNLSIYVDKGMVRRLASKGTTPFEFVFYRP